MNKIISQKEFIQEVVKNTGLSLVQFKTDWNGACQILAPVYDHLASNYNGKANFFTIDMEENKSLCGEYGISEVPVILFFKQGELVDYVAGLTSKTIIVSKIEKALS